MKEITYILNGENKYIEVADDFLPFGEIWIPIFSNRTVLFSDKNQNPSKDELVEDFICLKWSGQMIDDKYLFIDVNKIA